jgi:uncharacterized integral membrane protein
VLNILKWLSLAVSALVLIVFAVENRHAITVSLFPLPYSLDLPAYLFAAIFFVSGFSVAAFFALVRRLRLRVMLRQSEKHRKALESDIARMQHSARQELATSSHDAPR